MDSAMTAQPESTAYGETIETLAPPVSCVFLMFKETDLSDLSNSTDSFLLESRSPVSESPPASSSPGDDWLPSNLGTNPISGSEARPEERREKDVAKEREKDMARPKEREVAEREKKTAQSNAEKQVRSTLQR